MVFDLNRIRLRTWTHAMHLHCVVTFSGFDSFYHCIQLAWHVIHRETFLLIHLCGYSYSRAVICVVIKIMKNMVQTSFE